MEQVQQNEIRGLLQILEQTAQIAEDAILTDAYKNAEDRCIAQFNKVLKRLHKFAVTYLDDIIIFSKNEEHLEHLRIIFQRLKEAGLKLKRSKCDFMKTQIQYLGHLISSDGIQPHLDLLIFRPASLSLWKIILRCSRCYSLLLNMMISKYVTANLCSPFKTLLIRA